MNNVVGLAIVIFIAAWLFGNGGAGAGDGDGDGDGDGANNAGTRRNGNASNNTASTDYPPRASGRAGRAAAAAAAGEAAASRRGERRLIQVKPELKDTYAKEMERVASIDTLEGLAQFEADIADYAPPDLKSAAESAALEVRALHTLVYRLSEMVL